MKPVVVITGIGMANGNQNNKQHEGGMIGAGSNF
jgi:hypothetical protein